MNRRRALRLSLVALAALVVVALVAGIAVGTVVVRRPLPTRDGEVTLTGLDAQVRVVRDDRGVASIYADSPDDLFRAQGYVTAQDRFFEMDLRRHVTSGRLSELVGEDTDAMDADVLVRTLGWRRVAEQELSLLEQSTREALEAFAAGVNDYVRDRTPSELSLSYTLLARDHQLPAIEPWTPVDSLAWLKAVAWDLKSDYAAELGRARSFTTVRDVRRVEQLYPAYPHELNPPVLTVGTVPADRGGPASTTTSGSAVPPSARTATRAASGEATELLHALLEASSVGALHAADDALAALPGSTAGADSIGSNTWVVDGARTTSGKPLLANDLHLATSVPGALYQVGLHCTTVGERCPYDVTGYTFASLPGVVVGHNATIAWGLSNLYSDVTDLYLERLSSDGRGYERDGETLPLQTRTEEIKVADGPTTTITVRSTVHGPLISDASAAVKGAAPALADGTDADHDAGQTYGVSLAWTALTPNRTMDAVLAVDRASSFTDFRAAAARFAVPAQNLVYADVEGHIGYVTPGVLPLRKGGKVGNVPADGSWPQPGWDSSFDWVGTVPPAELPWVLDPPEGLIVAANQAVTGPQFPVQLGKDTDYGFRAARIRTLVQRAQDSGHKLDVDALEGIQDDTHDPIAEILVPLLLRARVDAFTQEAQDLLRGWNYEQPVDSAAAAYFNSVWSTLLDLAFADELPTGARPDGGSRWFEVVRLLLERPNDPWWDDRRTPGVLETRDAMLVRALETARLRLTSTIGKDPSRWRWGQLHTVTLKQEPLGGDGVPGLIHRLVNKGPYPAPGGSSVVDAFAWDAASGTFHVTAAPAMRLVVDLADLDASRWVNQTGQSGHPFDAHYGDQIDAWLEGRTYPWPSSRKAVDDAGEDVLVLKPGS